MIGLLQAANQRTEILQSFSDQFRPFAQHISADLSGAFCSSMKQISGGAASTFRLTMKHVPARL